MKKTIILIAAIAFSAATFAQKVEVKNDEIVSEGKVIAKIEKDGCGAVSPSCSFFIRNSKGELLITVTALDMKDPSEVNAGNIDGMVRFLRYSFVGIDGVAEIANPAMLATKPKNAAQSIVKWGLIKDDKLDEAAVTHFIQANGTRYTDRQKELNPQIIIIDERR